MGTLNKVLVLAVLTGCVDRDPPVWVELNYLQEGVPDSVKNFAEPGAWAWWQTEIGWKEYDPNSTVPLCPLDWSTQDSPHCRIRIDIEFNYPSELGTNAAGISPWGWTDVNNRHTKINNTLHDFDIMHTVAHEVGHSIFFTTEHLPDGEHGIMNAFADADVTEPTPDDYRFAEAHLNGYWTYNQ